MKVSKWKCKVCKKLLSSKQSGLHHGNKVHSIIIDMKDHIYKTPEEAKRASEMLGLGGEIHTHDTPDGRIYMPGSTM